LTEERQEPREASLRLFVAVELPESWLSGLGTLQDELRVRMGPAVALRWVRPEGIHLTLKFIGQVPAGLRSQLEAVLAAAVPAPPGIRIELAAPGTFGERGRVRVVWAGLEGDITRLRELAGKIDAATSSAGIARERRPLAPHLTLARVPEDLTGASAALLAAAIDTTHVPRLPALEIERVSLMQSHLGPGGARYDRLAVFPQPDGRDS
jgi:RNA 2',3'-cyclic 3'-phosphodiesterase